MIIKTRHYNPIVTESPLYSKLLSKNIDQSEEIKDIIHKFISKYIYQQRNEIKITSECLNLSRNVWYSKKNETDIIKLKE